MQQTTSASSPNQQPSFSISTYLLHCKPCLCCLQIIGDMLSDPIEKQHVSAYIADRASRGLRSLGIARSADAGASWSLIGLVSLLDPPREDSMETIRRAQALGVEVSLSARGLLRCTICTLQNVALQAFIVEDFVCMGL